MLTIAAMPMPSSYPFLAHMKELKKENFYLSRQLVVARSNAKDAKGEASRVKEDNKMMDKIHFLQGKS